MAVGTLCCHLVSAKMRLLESTELEGDLTSAEIFVLIDHADLNKPLLTASTQNTDAILEIPLSSSRYEDTCNSFTIGPM